MIIHAVIEGKSLDRRASGRRLVRLKGVARTDLDETAVRVEIRDLSATGMLLQTAASLRLGEQIEVGFGNSLKRAEVVWRSGQLTGCQFKQRLTKAELSAAVLRSAPAGDETDTNDVTLQLQSVSARLAMLRDEIEGLQRRFSSPKTDRKPVELLDRSVEENFQIPRGLEETERLPLAVRGWTILLSALLSWALLLWALKLI